MTLPLFATFPPPAEEGGRPAARRDGAVAPLVPEPRLRPAPGEAARFFAAVRTPSCPSPSPTTRLRSARKHRFAARLLHRRRADDETVCAEGHWRCAHRPLRLLPPSPRRKPVGGASAAGAGLNTGFAFPQQSCKLRHILRARRVFPPLCDDWVCRPDIVIAPKSPQMPPGKVSHAGSRGCRGASAPDRAKRTAAIAVAMARMRDKARRRMRRAEHSRICVTDD